jgi:hypothetical protein
MCSWPSDLKSVLYSRAGLDRGHGACQSMYVVGGRFGEAEGSDGGGCSS